MSDLSNQNMTRADGRFNAITNLITVGIFTLLLLVAVGAYNLVILEAIQDNSCTCEAITEVARLRGEEIE